MRFAWKSSLFSFLLFLPFYSYADTKQVTLQIEFEQKKYDLALEVEYSLLTQLCQVVVKLKTGIDKHLCLYMKGNQYPVIHLKSFHDWISSHTSDFITTLPKNYPLFEKGKLTYKKDGFWYEREHLDFLTKDQKIEFYLNDETKPKLTYKFLVK
jgi:hypothetical protein